MSQPDTQILHSSPALHSLKRAQLVQLCKRHGLRAAGKNSELVARLREYSSALPTSSSSSSAFGGSVVDYSVPISDDGGDDGDESIATERNTQKQARPSELWEVVDVMDDIPEDPEEGSGRSTSSKKSVCTLTAAAGGEFGTKSTLSKSTSMSVSSSLKSLASSFGVGGAAKRAPQAVDAAPLERTRLASFTQSQNMSGTTARDSLTANAVPYAALPHARVSQLPATEPWAFSYSGAGDTSLGDQADISCDAIPGMGARAGVPLPSSSLALDGTGIVPSATIRLVTASSSSTLASTAGNVVTNDSVAQFASPALPRLQPIQPAFELVPPTPAPGDALGLRKGKVKVWPMSPESLGRPGHVLDDGDGDGERLYPRFNLQEKLLAQRAADANEDDKGSMDVEISGGIVVESEPAGLRAPSPAPFAFGSPAAEKSRADFTRAASSVLAEMNARLGGAGIGAGLLASLTGKSSNNNNNDSAAKGMSEEELLSYQFGGAKGHEGSKKGKEPADEGSMKWRFDRAHESVFSKMDGIDTHYAARRPDKSKEQLAPLPTNRKRKSSVLERGGAGPGIGKGRPSVVKTRRSSAATARVISAGAARRRGRGIPGAFGDDDDDDDEDEEEVQGAKRLCVADSTVEGGRAKRVSIAPAPNDRNDDDAEGEDEDDDRRRKRDEGIRRRLDAAKARRRSSRGRPSIGPRASLVAPQPKGATSRFGFLSSAKSLVKSVWNRGAGAPTPTTSIPVVKAAPMARKAQPKPSANTVPGPVVSKPPIPETKKPAFGARSSVRPVRPSTARNVSNSSRTSSTAFLRPDNKAAGMGSVKSTASAVSAASAASSTRPRSRSPIPSFNPPSGSVRSTRSSAASAAPASIPGSTRTRNSSMRNSTNAQSTAAGSRVSSMGTRGSSARSTGTSAGVGSMGTQTRMRPSSTLYAPTASSLAKAVRRPSPSSDAGGSGLKIPESQSSRVSPSRIPVVLPLSVSPKKNISSSMGDNSSIFSAPLVLPTSPTAKAAADACQTVNPITGIMSPTRTRVPFAPTPSIAQNLDAVVNSGASAGPTTDGKVAKSDSGSMKRKPRISRSKVIAKLGAQRARNVSGSGNANAGSTPAAKSKGRTRSSVGVAAARRSIGGAKARGSATGVMMSAKRRERMSEYARRRSTKVSSELRAAMGNSSNTDEMEVDA